MIRDPAEAKVAADLAAPDVTAGIGGRRWRMIAFAFPCLDFAVSATEPGGGRSEYGFRAELSNYPAQAPLVRIWDFGCNAALAPASRPKGGPRLQRSFQAWQMDTVYRAWDRMTGPHNNNRVSSPHLAWHPGRSLSFILEDLHALLNANARPGGIRLSA